MTIKLPRKFIAVSESVEEVFRSEMKSSNTIVINNGIDAVAMSRVNGFTKADLGLEKKFVIGAIGRLVPIKSYDILIKAFKAADIKNSLLCIVGDGPERKRLEQLSAGASVIFMGHRTDAVKFYSVFDCFVLPSESEGLSIAFLEALSFGLPIITTCNLLVNNKNGFIVPIKDVLSIKTAIIQLNNDPIARKRMGLENINLVKEKFNIDTMTSCYEKLYASILRV